MKNITHFTLTLFLSFYLCPVSAQETIRDREGNVYRTIQVGEQIWMAENLKSTRFLNGDPIPNVREAKQWKDLSSAGYCNMNNNPDYTKTYGCLYNWYSASDPRNVCPAGWHVPSDQEWGVLIKVLSGEKGPGIVLPEMAALNKEVFRLLPEGFRGYDGEFTGIGYGGGGWWSSTSCTDETAFYRGVTYNTACSVRMEGLKYYGYHIRCVKD